MLGDPLSCGNSPSLPATYFHPRDFEPDQPLLPGLGPMRRFKSYYGLGQSEAKLRAILPEYRRLVTKATKGEAFADAMTKRIEALLVQP